MGYGQGFFRKEGSKDWGARESSGQLCLDLVEGIEAASGSRGQQGRGLGGQLPGGTFAVFAGCYVRPGEAPKVSSHPETLQIIWKDRLLPLSNYNHKIMGGIDNPQPSLATQSVPLGLKGARQPGRGRGQPRGPVGLGSPQRKGIQMDSGLERGQRQTQAQAPCPVWGSLERPAQPSGTS